MALIFCSSCGKSISDQADKCPHCMAVIDKRPKIKCEECNKEIIPEFEVTEKANTSKAYEKKVGRTFVWRVTCPPEDYWESLPCKYCGCPQPPPKIVICQNPYCGQPINPFANLEKKDIFCYTCKAPLAFENSPEKDQIKIKNDFNRAYEREVNQKVDEYNENDFKIKLIFFILVPICFGIGFLRMGNNSGDSYKYDDRLDRLYERSIPQRQKIDLNIYER